MSADKNDATQPSAGSKERDRFGNLPAIEIELADRLISDPGVHIEIGG